MTDRSAAGSVRQARKTSCFLQVKFVICFTGYQVGYRRDEAV